jgi:hypothetical protein
MSKSTVLFLSVISRADHPRAGGQLLHFLRDDLLACYLDRQQRSISFVLGFNVSSTWFAQYA